MIGKNSLFGPLDPAPDAGYADPPPRKGFFTDTSICIGCKACEVACKEWNEVPDDGFDMLGMSYDNTGVAERQHLAARGVHRAAASRRGRPGAAPVDLGMPSTGARPGADDGQRPRVAAPTTSPTSAG